MDLWIYGSMDLWIYFRCDVIGDSDQISNSASSADDTDRLFPDLPSAGTLVCEPGSHTRALTRRAAVKWLVLWDVIGLAVAVEGAA